jgi:hypothetical protein
VTADAGGAAGAGRDDGQLGDAGDADHEGATAPLPTGRATYVAVGALISGQSNLEPLQASGI